MFEQFMYEKDEKTSIVKSTLERILSCEDASHILEIYAKNGSIVNGSFGNWIGIMVETDGKFPNESLDDILDRIECEDFSRYGFRLAISVEPSDAERGHGIILWKKE